MSRTKVFVCLFSSSFRNDFKDSGLRFKGKAQADEKTQHTCNM
jgi:hypothetical protein